MDDVSKGHDSATVIRQPANYDSVKANALRAEQARRQAADEARATAEIEQMIARDKLDPRQQWYLKNVVTGRLIRTNADYHRAEENHHPLKQITYNQAHDLFRKEESVKKNALKAQLKKAEAKKARKRNRRG